MQSYNFLKKTKIFSLKSPFTQQNSTHSSRKKKMSQEAKLPKMLADLCIVEQQNDFKKWEELVTLILSKSVDSQTSVEELDEYLNYFFKLFCCNTSNEQDVNVRLKAIYRNVATMNEEFKTISDKFGCMHFEFENRNLISQETETRRKLTLVAFCIRTSYESATCMRMLQDVVIKTDLISQRFKSELK